ncbi:hypothetical protein ACLB2K_044742 [Fragaria x ananassa]
MDNVVVTVVKDVGKSCLSTSVVVDDCAEMIDENDYLDFRDKLRKFAVQSGFHYVLSRNDSIYVNAVCANRDVDHCGWEVLGSIASINQCFYITRFNNVHTCRGMIRNRSHWQLGSKIVRTCIESTVCLNLGLKPREIMSNFKSTYGYEISYKVASRAKKRCVEKMYGSKCDSFSMLSWFKEAVLETNLGSSVVLEVDESTERFKRVFVAYAGQIQGFKFSLPVLYVDGAFGKSKYKGQILAATGRNGNKGCWYGIMANGIAESFNNWIVAERSLPPFAMLDQTRMKEMKMMSERSVESKSWITKLTPKMEKRLKEQLDRSRVFRMIASHENVYEVRNDKICYSFPIAPLSNVDASCSSTEDFILPHVTKTPARRPKSKRITSAGEKKLIRCGRCNKMGHHNKKSCTEPLNMLL